MTSKSQNSHVNSYIDSTRESPTELKEESLSNGFVPGDKDVIVGRGKKCYNHVGNKDLRRIIKSKLDEYSATTCKHDKSCILACIIEQIRKNGGFVKEDPTTGRWYDVGDTLAREKISQTFRDALQDKYRSSTASKRKRRQEKRAKAAVTCSETDYFPIFLPQHLERKYEQQSLTSTYDSSLSSSMASWDLGSTCSEPISIQRPSLSQSLTVLDLESASSEPVTVVDSLSSSLPNDWFEDAEDPFRPIPVSKHESTEYYSITSPSNVAEIGYRSDCFEPIKFTDDYSDPSHNSNEENGRWNEWACKDDTNKSYEIPSESDDPWERSIHK